jgi:hypothetical protein
MPQMRGKSGRDAMTDIIIEVDGIRLPFEDLEDDMLLTLKNLIEAKLIFNKLAAMRSKQ